MLCLTALHGQIKIYERKKSKKYSVLEVSPGVAIPAPGALFALKLILAHIGIVFFFEIAIFHLHTWSYMVRCGPMWSDAVISHTHVWCKGFVEQLSFEAGVEEWRKMDGESV